jgi:hypothetical protein
MHQTTQRPSNQNSIEHCIGRRNSSTPFRRSRKTGEVDQHPHRWVGSRSGTTQKEAQRTRPKTCRQLRQTHCAETETTAERATANDRGHRRLLPLTAQRSGWTASDAESVPTVAAAVRKAGGICG